MGRLRFTAWVAASLIALPTGAFAADLLEPPVIKPPPVKVGKAWYLRGHIGMSNQHLDNIYHEAMDGPAFFEWLDEGNFDSAPTFGIGVGYQHNPWLRFDVFGEYRGKASFAAQDRYDTSDNPPDFDSGDAGDWGINDYTAKKSEWLFMANAYADIGTWHGLTPYVGAGVGASYNIISNFRDNNIIQGGGGEAGSAGMWNFAWALHAGVAFKASDTVTVDLGYSFLSLGNARTDTLYNLNGTCSSCQPVTFNNLGSHDLRLTLRYALGKPAYVPSYETPTVVKY